jgi:NAD(P)-dependent dehydrogenase (short-subunit alcohol dehydrogenase family)
MTNWTTTDIPDQTGRTAVVTGANTGLGYETAKALAEKGAHVVLAVRNADKGNDAAARIVNTAPGASVAVADSTSRRSTRSAGPPRNCGSRTTPSTC